MVWARFSEVYNHRWPSRAMSEFRPDRGVDGKGLYSVKREVLEAARAAGKATEAKKPAKPAPDGPERNPADRLDDRDHAAGRDDASGDELESVRRPRLGVRFPKPDSAG